MIISSKSSSNSSLGNLSNNSSSKSSSNSLSNSSSNPLSKPSRNLVTKSIFLFIISAITLLSQINANAGSLTRFYPTGSVKKVQQVTAEFSTDMIAMGDPRAKTNPFEILCNNLSKKKTSASKGKTEIPAYTTRWADSKHWVLDFEKPLPAGIRCEFTLNEDFKDLSGEKITGMETYSFSTSGPAILGVTPHYGGIEPDQYFVILTDGPVDPKSVESKAYFEIEGIPEKVGVKIISGKEHAKEREAILKSAVKDNWNWRSFANLIKQKTTKPISQMKEFDSFLILASQRRFPEEAKVVLHWPTGILSQSGLPVEEAQTYDFKVIKPFEARFMCERTVPERPCNPILDMTLNFTNRMPLKLLKGTKLVADNGQTWVPVELQEGDQNKNKNIHMSTKPGRGVNVKLITNFEDKQVDAITFKAPFPESTKFKLILPSGLKDELGRTLINQNKFPLQIATDEYSPLLKFSAPFGILEWKADPILPLSVRNLEKQLAIQQLNYEGKSLNLSSSANLSEIINWYHSVLEKDHLDDDRNKSLLGADKGLKFQLPKPMGEREFETMGIPLKKPGFYVVEMMSPKLGEALTAKGPMYVATAALVTDMAVHFKKGRESSLVWVTQLSDAKPVSGAKVSIVNSEGVELKSGVTNAEGIFKTSEIKYPCSQNSDDEGEYDSPKKCEVFVFAQKGEDLSFVSSSWSKGIENYRFNIYNEYLSKTWGPAKMHTILNRMVAQPGETIQMKHVLREKHENGFSLMNEKKLPRQVFIVHQGTQKTYTLPFDYDKTTGSAVNTFKIPKDASLGQYSVYLSNKDKHVKKANESDESAFDWSAQQTGYFLVSEYRLPLMKANLKIQNTPLIRPTEVKVDLSAHYLSGGPAKGMKIKLRSSIERGSFAPDVPGGSEYNFFAQPMKTGVFDTEYHQESEESFLKVQELVLDQEGGLHSSVKGIPPVKRVQNLTLEMEYTDPSGEVKTASAEAKLFPSETVVGLRTDSWLFEPGKSKVMGVIADINGKPKSGRSYTVNAFKTNYITHRKRLVGGFYSFDSKIETTSLGKVCEGKTDELGRFLCEPKNLPVGSITLQASTQDDKGFSTYANAGISVYESGTDSWWVPSDSDRIDLLPEKNFYEPNSTAKLVVRSPYLVATILVTIEREGVLDSFVTTVHRDNPIIEVPLKGNYAPNVFISAMVIRGRVGEPQPTALIDLARPAMKMGMTKLLVGWKAHELLVDVKTDKKTYQAREKAQVNIQVKSAMGLKLPVGSEVAVVAVDESLLRLKTNTSWEILQEMMGERELAVSTSSAQNQVIGKRHFGSKAKPPGGSGGVMTADHREFFDPILLWNPHVKLNAEGEAKISIPLNDSITSFRIVAIATSGENLFGHGNTTIASTKDLIIYSGFSPLVRETDQIKNAFTIRNTTLKPMKVQVEVIAKVQDKEQDKSKVQELDKDKVQDKTNALDTSLKLEPFPLQDLNPSEARTLILPLSVPENIHEIQFQIKAKDTLSNSQDSMITKVRVEPSVPNRVLQATLFQLSNSNTIPVQQPQDALPGKGGLRTHFKPSLVDGLQGVKSYMEDYSYSCLEQKISRAIVLEDLNEIKRLIEILPSYTDSYGLLKYFPSSYCGSAQLTRYVLNILAANGFEIPNTLKEQMLNGVRSAVQGQYSCRSWWDDLVRNDYRSEEKILLLDALSQYKKFSLDLLSSVQITPNLWKTETVVAWYQLLKREPSILQRDQLLKQADNILHSRLNFQGSLMNLQGELNWESQWHLFTSKDQEALKVFGVSLDEETWSQDVGRMARGLVARLRLGHWDTTMANAWGVTLMKQFSQKFEKVKVDGETHWSAGENKETFKWKDSPKGYSKMMNWPKDSVKNKMEVKFSHAGSGQPWVQFETLSAIPLKAPFEMGYKVLRKVTPVVQEKPGQWQVGDVANVELTVAANADQSWVVIRDPIPAGASHLGTGLEGSSKILDRTTQKKSGSAEVEEWPTEFEEKSFTNFTSYAAYLPRGTYRLNYRIRLNSAGEFKIPPTRIEAMYSPETFGEVPNAHWKVVQ